MAFIDAVTFFSVSGAGQLLICNGVSKEFIGKAYLGKLV